MALIENKEISITGRLFRIARLRAEYFETVDDPARFLVSMREARIKADVFSFVQPLAERIPRYDFHLEWDCLSVMPITTYEDWCQKRINGKTRNMIRKAEKHGVEVRTSEFNDDFVRGIQQIYDESPLRQGKPFQHYGKGFEWLKQAHATYLEKCEFIGAYSNGDLIGFVKLFHGNGISSLMQIISKISSRDKAPTNALIAKAVQICAQRGVPYLHYGVWSRRSLGEFKKHHAFEQFRVPRFYLPLNCRGRVAMALGMHRKLVDRVPEYLQDTFADWRAGWYTRKYGANGG